MDEYGQIGPEKGDYQDDLATIAEALKIGPVRIKLADRMTRYDLVLATADRMGWLAAEPDRELGAPVEHWLLVAQDRRGCGWFRLGTPHAAYVAEVMRMANAGDGEVIAAFIAALAPHVIGDPQWSPPSPEVAGA